MHQGNNNISGEAWLHKWSGLRKKGLSPPFPPTYILRVEASTPIIEDCVEIEAAAAARERGEEEKEALPCFLRRWPVD